MTVRRDPHFLISSCPLLSKPQGYKINLFNQRKKGCVYASHGSLPRYKTFRIFHSLSLSLSIRKVDFVAFAVSIVVCRDTLIFVTGNVISGSAIRCRANLSQWHNEHGRCRAYPRVSDNYLRHDCQLNIVPAPAGVACLASLLRAHCFRAFLFWLVHAGEGVGEERRKRWYGGDRRQSAATCVAEQTVFIHPRFNS